MAVQHVDYPYFFVQGALMVKAGGRELHRGSPTNEITITGFIKSIRRQKRVSFAVVSDGSNAKGLQAVFLGESGQAVLKDLTNGAS
ncbi:hypothetical protein MPER_10514, partial [Moniliophthora perniciosa FA553]